MSENLKNIAAIVPSLNPDDNLFLVIEGLHDIGFSEIVVVNDGSKPECGGYFETAAEKPYVTLLTHEVNRGKGAALRTAFEFLADNRPGCDGAVTVDADNQHKPEDAVAVTEKMLETGESAFGVRNFKKAGVPLRSRFGNLTTSAVLLVFCGIRLSDTQTGLRAFPKKLFGFLCGISGDRYEYETNMILEMKSAGHGFSEVEINTVYINDNKGSHFRVVRDSMRIYGLILKFLASSIASFVVDYILFYLLMLLFAVLIPSELWRIAASTVLARAVSSVVNFALNRKAVFKCRASVGKTMLRYYCLAIPQMCVSALLVYLLNALLGQNGAFVTTLIKIAVDIVLFLISFRIQRNWVFKNENK